MVENPMTKTTFNGGFFITGTDTEIGKTYAACCIAHTIKQHFPNLKIYPRKPVASGAIRRNGQLISEDAEQLLNASQSDEKLETICPYTFEAAISPERAIQQTKRNITCDDLLQATKSPEKGLKLVEGAGGFYSPLTVDCLNKDLAVALNLPIILVVGNRLGCINHALLTVKAIEDAGLYLAAILVNDCSSNADYHNVTDIQSRTRVPVIHLNHSADNHWQTIPKLNYFLKF